MFYEDTVPTETKEISKNELKFTTHFNASELKVAGIVNIRLGFMNWLPL